MLILRVASLLSIANRYPGKLYLPKHMETFRGKRLTMKEIYELLYDAPASDDKSRGVIGLQFCRRHNIELRHIGSGGGYYAEFADVESTVLKKLPRGFPIFNAEIGLKYSDALCVIRRNSLSTTKAPFRSVIEPLEHGHIYCRLGSHSIYGVASIFDRHGFTEPDGSHIRVATHQFRHYLNTLAQAGGLSQLDIAKWSGRKDIRQNDVYDHLSAKEMLSQIQAAVGEHHMMFGPLANLPKTVLIPRDEFARLKVPTAHTTEFGYCIHDFTMSPCQQFRDCLNCEEQVCIKGDIERTARLKQRLAETKHLLDLSKAGLEAEEYGASRWVEHHRSTLTRLNQLCEILDDPIVPLGSFVQLASPNAPSGIAQANARRISAGFDAPKLECPIMLVKSEKN